MRTATSDPDFADPERQLLGADQEQFLFEQLATGAQWKIIGQQVMVGQLPQFFNSDAWDGYPAARQRMFDAIAAVDDVVVLTGDIHSSWALDLTADPESDSYDPDTGAGSIAVEIIVPGITSPGLEGLGPQVAEFLVDANRHMKFVNLDKRGYVVLDIDEQRVEATWYHVDTIEVVADGEAEAATVSVSAGTRHLVVEPAASPAPAAAPAPAP